MNSLQMRALIVKFWSHSIINLLMVWCQWPILLLCLSVWNKAPGMGSPSGWSVLMLNLGAHVSIFLMKDIFVNILDEVRLINAVMRWNYLCTGVGRREECWGLGDTCQQARAVTGTPPFANIISWNMRIFEIFDN